MISKEHVVTTHDIEVDGKPITVTHGVVKTAATPAVANEGTVTDNRKSEPSGKSRTARARSPRAKRSRG